MWNSFETTVVTPRKCPGLDAPSSRSLNPSTVTQVLAPAPYISSADGVNTTSVPSLRNISQSRSSERGYFARSSVGANCVGFTKIETTTSPQRLFAARASDRCPACSAPIVGTRPIETCFNRASRNASRTCSIVLQIFIPELTRREPTQYQPPTASGWPPPNPCWRGCALYLLAIRQALPTPPPCRTASRTPEVSPAPALLIRVSECGSRGWEGQPARFRPGAPPGRDYARPSIPWRPRTHEDWRREWNRSWPRRWPRAPLGWPLAANPNRPTAPGSELQSRSRA